ncbi:hypothetical protein ACVGXO_06610, partial [Enterobacter hormaechei]
MLAGNKVDYLTFGGQVRLAAREGANQPVEGVLAFVGIVDQIVNYMGAHHAGLVGPHPARRKRLRG